MSEYSFAKEYRVIKSDVNNGRHLSYVAIVKYIEKTRVSYFASYHLDEGNIDNEQTGIILVNTKSTIRKQAELGDMIEVSLAVTNSSNVQLELTYRIRNLTQSCLVATAVEEFYYFNYRSNCLGQLPKPLEEIVDSM